MNRYSIYLTTFTLFFLLSTNLPAQVYVKWNATGANNGTSWANAYTNLQVALANTSNGQIWVAAGIYYPSSCSSCSDADRLAAFAMKDNVALYGGFAGNETSLGQRDYNTNQTILSGNIGAAGNADNSYRVVLAEDVGPSAILDGFIVEQGNADGGGGVETNFGGGIVLNADFSGFSSPAIQNCTIRNNTAAGGGGMSIYCNVGGSSAAVISNCTFENNTASINSVSFGGAVIITGSTGAQISAQFLNCTFTNNFTGSSGDGAALAAVPSGSTLALQINNCIFDSNTSSDRAGAILMRVTNGSSPNQAINQSVISNCTFTNNSASSDAGAIYDRASFGAISQTTFSNCQFSGNSAGGDGGALFLRGSQVSAGDAGLNEASVQSCTFDGNTASGFGGAVYIYGWQSGTCQPNISGTDITNNTATLEGGGVYIYAEDSGEVNPVFSNCTIENNSTDENGGGIGLELNTGGTADLSIAGGSISSNTAQTFGAGLYYRINPGGGIGDLQVSNCTLDNNSVQGGGGAMFLIVQTSVHFDPLIANCTISNNRASQSSVSFGAGIFFSGTGAILEPQVLNCNFIDNECINNDGGALAASIGGLSGNEFNPLIDNCGFTNNHAHDRAGAIYFRATEGQSQAVVRNCIFNGNTAGGNGAAFYDRASFGANTATQIINCRFIGNSSSGSPAVGSAEDGGGALYIRGTQGGTNNAVVTNCIFDNNTISGLPGGAIYCSGALNGANTGTCIPQIVNNTFYGNGASIGKGLYGAFADPFIANNIFWNSAIEISGVNFNPTINDCIIQDGYSGPGSIDNILTDDPQFVAPANGDFHLTACSPAINAGSNAAIPDDLADIDGDNNTSEQISLDLDGNSRVIGASVDLGCFERDGGGAVLTLGVQGTDASCAGECNGEAEANPNGGTPPFVFLWSTNQTTAIITDLCPGAYTVTITDAAGCSVMASVDIGGSASDPVTVDAGSDQSICDGATTTLNASASGGTGVYTYSWDNGLGDGESQSVTPSASTTYTVTVTDANNCSTEDEVTVTVNDVPTPAISGDTDFCAGESTVLDAGVFDTYAWSTAETSQTITVGSPGDYSVTVTDGNGCTGTDEVTIDELSLPGPAISGDLDFCAGATTVLDAGAFDEYAWSTAETSQTITVGSPGDYSVTVTDSNGCIGTDEVTVDELSLPAPAISGDLDFCAGATTVLDAGTFDEYAWSTAETSQTITVTSPGDYSVTVTDGNGCSGMDQVTVSELSLPAPAISGALDFCAGATTDLDAGAFDSYAWSTAETSQTITVGSPGDYSVTVTDSNGCTGTDQVTVSELSLPAPSISGGTDFCGGESTVLDAGVFDTYLWSTAETSQTITVSSAGDYSVTVTDGNGCTGTDEVSINEFSLPEPAITGDTDFCFGESAVLDAGIFDQYLWSTGETGQTITVIGGGNYSVTVTDGNGCQGEDIVQVTVFPLPAPSIAGDADFCAGGSTVLNAGDYSSYLWSTNETSQFIVVENTGTYSVTVTDDNGCTGDAQLLVTEFDEVQPQIAGQLSICTGASSVLDAGTYSSYFWSTGEMTQTITVTGPGNYSVTVTDTNGCTGEDAVTVTQTDELQPQIMGPSVLCSGSVAELDAGIFNSYQWSNNASTQTITISSPGIYSVTVMDSEGCIGTDMVTIEEVQSPVPEIQGQLSLCSGASTVLTVPEAFNSYLWSTNETAPTIAVTSGGNYGVTVTNAEGCTGIDQVSVTELPAPIPIITGEQNFCTGGSTVLDAGDFNAYLWSTNETTAAISVAESGIYSVTVTDENGCEGENAVSVAELPAPVPEITGQLSFCFGSATTLDAGAFNTYLWSTGETTQTITVTDPGNYGVTVTDTSGCTGETEVTVTESESLEPEIAGQLAFCFGSSTLLDAGAFDAYLWSTGETSQTINTSIAGSYSVTVTDDNGCTGTDEVNVTELSLPAPVISGDTDFCTGESTVLDAGVFDAYLWSTAETGQTISVSNPGAYSVTVTDGNGCQGEDMIQVTTLSLPAPSITGDTDFCAGGSTVLDAGDYTSYLWSTNETSPFIVVENTGTYSVTVTDDNGCTGDAQLSVTEFDEVQPQIVGQLSICTGASSVLDAGTYSSYLWSTGEMTQMITINGPGNYSVTVTDINGCTGEDAVIVTQTDELQPQITGPSVLCSGNSVMLDAGVFNSYQWSNNATTQTITISSQGTYSVTVADGEGCTGTDMVTIAEVQSPVPEIQGQLSLCSGASTLLTVPETFNSYLWSTDETTAAISVAESGIYSVTVTDENGCEGDNTVSVTELPVPIPEITGQLSFCSGSSTTLDAGVFDTYLWSTNETTQSITVDNPGAYSVTVTDASGCTGETAVTVTESESLEPEITGQLSFCSGSSTTLDAGVFDTYLWSTNATTQSITVDAPGAYSVTVTDAFGCNGEAAVTVTESESLEPEITGQLSFCSGSSTILDAGVFDTYLWSTNATTQSITVDAPGAYSVTVTDASGCTGETAVTVTESESLEPEITGQLSFCFGSSTTLDAGVFDSYLWSNNATTQSITVDAPGAYSVTVTDASGCSGETAVTVTESESLEPEITGQLSFCFGSSTTLDAGLFDTYLWSTNATTQSITVEAPGAYSVTVTDASGCSGETEVTVTESESLEPEITGQLSFCSGSSTTLDAGTFDTYLWSTNETTQSITVDNPGAYSVTVTDASGCSGETEVTVTESESLEPEITGQLSFCFGSSTTLDAGVFDAYLWSTNATTQSITVDIPGTYSVTVTDASGCSGETEITVTESESLEPEIMGQLSFCSGSSTILDAGLFDTYEWSTGETSQSITVEAPGAYSVTVTDASGCSGETAVTVTESESLEPEITGQLSFCFGSSTNLDAGVFDAYLWSTNATTQSITVEAPGAYSVTVTDASGCSGETEVTVTESESLEPEIMGQLSFCSGSSTILDAGLFDTYEWSTGETSQSITVEAPGAYSVTVTDASGCSGETAVTVTESESLEPEITGQLGFCSGHSTTLDAGVFDTYLWSTSETTQSITVEAPGAYSVTVTDENGCHGAKAVEVTLHPLPEIDAGEDITLKVGEEVQLMASGGIFYNWLVNDFLSCQDCPDPIANPDEDITYVLIGEDENGCVGRDTIRITVTDDIEEVIDPVNTITPNGDGVNDFFVIDGIEQFPEHNLTIFNRWGDTVFETLSYENDWDGQYNGRPLPAGTYIYMLVIRDGGEKYLVRNTITIVR